MSDAMAIEPPTWAAVRYGGDLKTEVVASAKVKDFVPENTSDFRNCSDDWYRIGTTTWSVDRSSQVYHGIIEGLGGTKERAEAARKCHIRNCDPNARQVLLEKLKKLDNYPMANSSDDGEQNASKGEVEADKRRAAKVAAIGGMQRALVLEKSPATLTPALKVTKSKPPKIKKTVTLVECEQVNQKKEAQRLKEIAIANANIGWGNFVSKVTKFPTTVVESTTNPPTIESISSSRSVITSGSSISGIAINTPLSQSGGSSSSAQPNSSTCSEKSNASSTSSKNGSALSNASQATHPTASSLDSDPVLMLQTVPGKCVHHICKNCNEGWSNSHGAQTCEQKFSAIERQLKILIDMVHRNSSANPTPQLIHGKQVIDGRVNLDDGVSCSLIGWEAMNTCRDTPDWCMAILRGTYGENCRLYRLSPRYDIYIKFPPDFLEAAKVYYSKFICRRIEELTKRVTLRPNDKLAKRQQDFFEKEYDELMKQILSTLSDKAEALQQQYETDLKRRGLPIPVKILLPKKDVREKKKYVPKRRLSTPKSLQPRKTRKKAQVNQQSDIQIATSNSETNVGTDSNQVSAILTTPTRNEIFEETSTRINRHHSGELVQTREEDLTSGDESLAPNNSEDQMSTDSDTGFNSDAEHSLPSEQALVRKDGVVIEHLGGYQTLEISEHLTL